MLASGALTAALTLPTRKQRDPDRPKAAQPVPTSLHSWAQSAGALGLVASTVLLASRVPPAWYCLMQ
jgi:hypothetical protein